MNELFRTHEMSTMRGTFYGLVAAALAVAGCQVQGVKNRCETMYDCNAGRICVSNICRAPADRVIVEGADGLTTTEAGGKASFTVRLSARPARPVILALHSSNENEVVVSPRAITISPLAYDQPFVVQLTGVADAVPDGTQTVTIAIGSQSQDPDFNGLGPELVTVKNLDVDAPGLTVSAPTDCATDESGGTCTLAVRLNMKPSGTVSVKLSSTDPSQGTVAPDQLTFTAADWQTPKSAVVTGVDDPTADGDVAYQILLASDGSEDPGYRALPPSSVSLVNHDHHHAGLVVVAPPNPTTTEYGGTVKVTVHLASQPTAPVLVAVSSDLTTEGTVSPSLLTFNRTNWTVDQTVVVTGVDDAQPDGDGVYHVTFDSSPSDEPGYHALPVTQLTIINHDTYYEYNPTLIGQGYGESMTPDGRFVLFSSDASNLVVGDQNGQTDLFVYDRTTQQIDRVSLNVGGAEFATASGSGQISADGRFVSFVNCDSPSSCHVYRRDRIGGATTLLSAGPQRYQYSSPSISADGARVAFLSGVDVCLYDGATGQSKVIARPPGVGSAVELSISADGRYVAYAANLDVQGTMRQVYLYDAQTGTTRMASATADGTPGDGVSQEPKFSAEGSLLVFETGANNLAPNRTTSGVAMVMCDVSAGGCRQLELGPGYNASGWFDISADAKQIAYTSVDNALVVYEPASRRTVQVAPPSSHAWNALTGISADGRVICFNADRSLLEPGAPAEQGLYCGTRH
jgi:Tol biopolymer transport system component